MVVHHSRELGKPEDRDFGQDTAFARDRVGQHDVKCAEPIRCDEEQVFGVDFVDVTNLAACEQLQTGKVRFKHGRLLWCGHWLRHGRHLSSW